MRIALTSLLLMWPLSAAAQPSSTPGALRSHTTLHSIGVEWDVSGDDDHDAGCTVRYRVAGSSAWSEALPLVRVDYAGSNMLAGSVMFLDPGASYELALALDDPDGGSDSRTLTVATRPTPTLPTGGRDLHVVPGGGGGAGTEADPLRGIDAAQAMAQPGDVFLLHAGDYGGRITFDVPGEPGSYIVWKAAGDGEVLLAGVEAAASHTWLEGLTIVVPSGDIGIHGTSMNPNDVVILRNTLRDCHYCVYPKTESRDWYIADNVIVGDVPAATGSLDGEGVELNHGDGHIVAYNSITNVADGVSYPGAGCDIYGNDIFDVSDDGIEPDDGPANVRVWGNRIHNAFHNGISFQPMGGAPWYLIRNQVIAGDNVIKVRDMDRAVMLHNTFVGWSEVVSGTAAGQLANAWSNNNLWISVNGWYAWENGGPGDPNWRTNLDYDGFDWGGYVYGFKWNNVRYTDLAEFVAATGLEPHGVVIDAATCFETFDVPAPPPASVPPQLMTLAAGCNAVDVGVRLPNINDDFSGAGPDLGAHERGGEAATYGPRAVRIVTSALPDATVDAPYSFALQAAGGRQPYTWSIRSGELPAGLTLAGNIIAGTPTALGSSALTVEVRDSAGASDARDFTLRVLEPGVDSGPSPGRDGAVPSSDGGPGGGGDTSGGCGCRIARPQAGAPLGLVALGLLLVLRRRRRSPLL